MTAEADASPASQEPSRTRYRLDIAYDGSGFSGWTRQPGLRTVQGELEDALATVFRRWGAAPTLTVAGRTDAGVHALGQVAHLDLDDAQRRSLDAPRRGGPRGSEPGGVLTLQRRLNGIAGLDTDVYVSSVREAALGFDARFSAIWRRYEYRVADTASVRDPLRRGSTLWYPASLDVDAMNEAAGSLLGLHDWAAYCKPREGATTIRTLEAFSWARDDDGVLLARVRADAFCRNMVRALVGASIAVGTGRITGERPAGIRDEATRGGSEFVVAPAKGLTLIEVGYPPDDELAARAELTRARRDADDLSASLRAGLRSTPGSE